MKSFTINSQCPFLKQWNGQKCSIDETKEPTIGKSGTTKLYNLASGGALFFHDNELKPE